LAAKFVLDTEEQLAKNVEIIIITSDARIEFSFRLWALINHYVSTTFICQRTAGLVTQVPLCRLVFGLVDQLLRVVLSEVERLAVAT
jgi:hypothetical protein